MVRKFLALPVFFYLLTFFFSAASTAQVALPGAPASKYLYLLKLKNPELRELSYNNSVFYGLDSTDAGIWSPLFYNKPVNNQVVVVDPLVRALVNTGYPSGYNDGPLWAGKGVTLEASAGIQGNYKALYFTFMPSVFYSQNLDFPLASVQPSIGKYNYQFATYGSIDYVQRYGDNSFVKLHPGQSEVRLSGKKLTIGIGTKNISWGPSVFNPLLMSKNAGGMLLGDAGITSPLPLKIGKTELGILGGRFYMGLPKRSEYHNSNSEAERRYLTGFSATYQPPFAKGLTLGVNRVLYKNLNRMDWNDLIASVYVYGEGPDTLANDYFDQLGSITTEYLIKDFGFRVYTELARNDFNGNMRDLLVDIEHSFAYTLGLQKTTELTSGKTLLFTFEHTKLSRDKGYLYRPTPPYYVHFLSTDGYTQDGQLIGAGIGPGSLSNNFALDWYSTEGVFGVSLRRIKFDNDFFITHYGYAVVPDVDFSNKDRQDAEYTVGMNYARMFRNYMLSFNAHFSYRFNWYYIDGNDQMNVGTAVSFRYFLNNQ